MFDPRQLVSVGNTDLKITRMSLGTGYLGGMGKAVSEERFTATVAQALQEALNYFDTAPLYGLGVSEQRLGHVLRQQVRDSFVLSTKIGRLLRSEIPADSSAVLDPAYDNAWYGVPPKKIVIDFGYGATLKSIEESLSRLGLDRIDIVYIHDAFTEVQYQAVMKGAYPALDKLRSEKVIRALGVGIGQTDVLKRFAHDANFDCFLVAGRYTLLDQLNSEELLSICQKSNISVVLGGVFNSGILADPYRRDAKFNYQPANQALVIKAQRIDTICQRHGIPLKAAALRFALAHPAVATILTGATFPHEIIENVRLLQIPIPAPLWSDLQREGLLSPFLPPP